MLLLTFGVQSSALAYAGASLALLALTCGPRGVAVALAPIIALHALALVSAATDDSGIASASVGALLGRALLLCACSVLGLRLRGLIFGNTELQRLIHVGELERAHSEERTRLAQEMHDSVSKTLHGVHLLSTVLTRRLSQEGHRRAADAEAISKATQAAREDARRLLGELRQAVPDELCAEIRSLACRWSGQNPDVRLSVRLPQQPITLGTGARFEVLRSVSELLENVHRHAHARQVTLSAAEEDGWAVIEVTDDGVGMAAPDLGWLHDNNHYGLVGVGERMARVNGKVSYTHTHPGTRVTLRLPAAAPIPQGRTYS